MGEPLERRKPDPQIEFLTAILNSVDKLHDKIGTIDEVKASVIELRRDVKEHIDDETSLCRAAFPNGDADGHRRAHEARIKEAEERAELYRRLRIKAGEMTVWAFLICVASVAIYYWNGHMPQSAHISMPVGK